MDRLLAISIILATVTGAWMFRYENIGPTGLLHVNRFTGAMCHISEECWIRGY